jgi:site-specific DNA-methyltransferase (adenine-specific)/adenine-specific DNA-methyltransferase
MNSEFRQMVIDTLMKEEDLPSEWARELFPPEKREYELIYFGKDREEDVIADTLAIPLQPVREFGSSNEQWQNMLVFGDNLQVMKTLLEMKQQGRLCNSDGTPGIRLVYIDPPFATKSEFKGSQDQKAYQDKVIGAKFLEFLRKRLIFLREILADDGTIYVHLDQKKGHYIKVIMDEIFKENRFINEVIWKYTKYQMRDMNKFAKNTDRLLWYSKSSAYKYNPITYKLDSPKKLLKKGWDKDLGRIINIKDNDGKTQKITIFDEKVDDLWDIPYIGATAHERLDYPTQKPEKLLDRVIRSASNEGDLILDAFAGSGTTLSVAEKLGRRWIGIDCGKLSIYTIQKRLLDISKSKDLEDSKKKYNKDCKPFKLYNAGLYDFSTLKKLPWDDWRFFALQLFGCKDERHIIDGFKLDGKLKGSSVLVFNYQQHAGKRIDEETIENIHNIIGRKLGRKFFIIAPRGVFAFQQDYIDLDGVRYYALRIPYSFINELHYREFSALQQPNDENSVNETVEAVGFDFIRPPKVEINVGLTNIDKKQAFIRINKFVSYARLKGEETKNGLEAFSIMMIDFNYNNNVFKLDVALYKHQLENNTWEYSFPYDKLGKNIMIIITDIFGNEAQIIKDIKEFK